MMMMIASAQHREKMLRFSLFSCIATTDKWSLVFHDVFYILLRTLLHVVVHMVFISNGCSSFLH